MGPLFGFALLSTVDLPFVFARVARAVSSFPFLALAGCPVGPPPGSCLVIAGQAPSPQQLEQGLSNRLRVVGMEIPTFVLSQL